MAGERVTLWTSAAAAGATFVAVAISATIIWNSASKQRAQFLTELTALNAKFETIGAKVDKTGETIAEIKKIAALESTAQQIGLLNAELKKTNEKLAQLDAKIEKTGVTLAELKKPSPNDDLRAEFSGIKSTLAQLSTRLEAKIEASNKVLTDIKAAPGIATDTTGDPERDKTLAKLDAAVGKLNDAVSGLRTDFASQTSAQIDSLKAMTNSIDTLKAAITTQKAELRVQSHRAPSLAAPETTSSIAPTQPLTIHFDKTGRSHLDTQTAALVGNLKTIMKSRRNCAIMVAGHTDTLGPADANLDVSKERADAIAAKLRAAFPGETIQINSVGKGERQLKVRTPDGVTNAANRRVEVSVACKG